MPNPNGQPGNLGGKSLQDRKLAARVRSLALTKILDLLSLDAKQMDAETKELHNTILIKLSGTVLPRLNEHSGEDGEPMVINIIKYDGSNSTPQLPT